MFAGRTNDDGQRLLSLVFCLDVGWQWSNVDAGRRILPPQRSRKGDWCPSLAAQLQPHRLALRVHVGLHRPRPRRTVFRGRALRWAFTQIHHFEYNIHHLMPCLIQNSSFLIQNPPFLMQNSSLSNRPYAAAATAATCSAGGTWSDE